MNRAPFEGTTPPHRGATAVTWGSVGGLVAGLVAAQLECLFLLFHVGAFALSPSIVLRAVATDMLAGIAVGAAVGLIACRYRVCVREAREAVAITFAAVLAGFGAAFLVSYLRGMAFPPHRLSLQAPSAVAVAAALSLLAFVVLSRLGARLVRWALTLRARGSRLPLLVAVAVSLTLVAALLFLTRQSWRSEVLDGAGVRRGRPSVLLVVLDAARPDFFSVYGGPGRLTPNLDRLAAEGQVFLHAYSSSNWSIPGHASLFSGLYPTSHGAIEVQSRLDARVPVLAQILSRSGWASGSFYENALLGPPAGLTKGFSVAVGPGLDHRTALTIDWWIERLTHRGSRTAQCLGLARDWIEYSAASGRPYFVFLNLMSTHFPYQARQPYFDNILRGSGLRPADCGALAALSDWEMNQQSVWRRLEHMTPDELACLRALYASNISHLDAVLGEFLGRLRSAGRLENAIVVVTSDHGENLGEHGLFTHMRNALYEQATRVPLIVWAPGRLRPERITKPVSLVDVMPTILALAGLEREVPSGLQGVDLRHPTTERMVLSEYWDEEKRACSRAAVVGRRKIVARSDGTLALFDLAADPGEARDLATLEPDEAARLHASLLRLVAGLRPLPAVKPDARALDEQRKRLRSLGYIQ